MNQMFDFGRFGKYFAYLAKVGSRKYLGYMAAVWGVMFALCLWRIFVIGVYRFVYEDLDYDPMWSGEFGTFTTVLFVVLVIAGSMTFVDMGEKPSRLSALMLPASQLEKFVARLIVALPVTFVFCVLGFEVVDLLRCLVAKISYPDLDCIKPIGLATDYYDSDSVKVFFGILLGMQSTFVLGSAIWPKSSWLKTFAALFLIGTMYSFVSLWLSMALFDYDMHYNFRQFEFVRNIDPYNAVLAVGCVTAAVNYTLAYFRLRELELIQRW